ncbi:hypothetical protein N431DRAFT_111210 [Stipitochalara longipes BDJ]|nr:hypothetical protein N431DRAFT_111210 [Stipitochalara longipes BDJ]
MKTRKKSCHCPSSTSSLHLHSTPHQIPSCHLKHPFPLSHPTFAPRISPSLPSRPFPSQQLIISNLQSSSESFIPVAKQCLTAWRSGPVPSRPGCDRESADALGVLFFLEFVCELVACFLFRGKCGGDALGGT